MAAARAAGGLRWIPQALGQWTCTHLDGGHGGEQGVVGDGDLVAGGILVTLEECVHEAEGLLQLLQLLLVLGGAAEHLGVLRGTTVKGKLVELLP